MESKAHQEIINKALEIAKAGVADNLTIGEIAKKVGYSQSWLGAIFKQVTGHSLIEHVIGIRLEEAKRLLSQTDLNVIEIAFETGFGSHEHFTRCFRGKTGVSPTQFRNANKPANQSGGPFLQNVPPPESGREWFKQDFAGEELSKDIEVRDGTFHQKDGFAEGTGIEAFGFVLMRALPENVEISLEIKILSAQNNGPSHLLLSFSDESFTSFWYQFTLGEHDPGTCAIRQLGNTRRIRTDSPIKPDQWQRLRVQVLDAHMRVYLDEETLFEFQNDFPPLYNQRSRLRFGSWRSPVHFRKLTIKDLGFPTLVKAVRQGDALYNANSFVAAREFYCRLLEMQGRSSGLSELQYKIGMCFFSQNALTQARTWLEKASTGMAGFWAEQAKIGLMRLDILESGPTGLETARQFLADPAMRDETRTAVEGICGHYWNRGDFDRIVSLQKVILENAGEGGPLWFTSLRAIAEAQGWLFLLEESEQNLNAIINMKAMPSEIRIMALRELGYICRVRGKLDEAESCFSRISTSTKNPGILADCEVNRAFLLRARNRVDEALALLDNVASRHGIPDRSAWAKLETSLVLSAIGKPEQARKAIAEARTLCPSISYLQPGGASHYTYVPELVSGNLAAAAEILLSDSRAQGGSAFRHAQQAMAAGFIMEMAGDKGKARRVRAEALRRFPLQQCSHFAPAVELLLKGEMPELNRLPLGSEGLSEMLYLAALASKAKGDHARCKAHLERCVQLDGSLRWPAHLAKQLLSRITPSQ